MVKNLLKTNLVSIIMLVAIIVVYIAIEFNSFSSMVGVYTLE